MAILKNESLNWADDVDGDEASLSDPKDEIKTVVDEVENEDGKIVRTTRKIRMKLVKQHANHAAVERKKLPKFGLSKGQKPGPDTSTTQLGEIVLLKLSMGIKSESEKPLDEDASKLVKVSKSTLVCRICKGDHWTLKCPFKDSMPEEPLVPIEKEETPTVTDDKPAKYIPRMMRDRPAGESASRSSRSDDPNTIRITNLSEDTTESDVRDLVMKFGNTSRVFVARDRDTNTCKGYAFVTFHIRSDAERALNKLNGYGYDNLILKVEWAKSNKD